MKPTFTRRFRRHISSSKERSFFKQSHEQSFFADKPSHDMFFKPTVVNTQSAIPRKCEHCETEEKNLQRLPQQKEEEEKKVMRLDEKKEEEKLQKKESSNHVGNSTSVTTNYISALNGKGQSLPKQQQYFFGSRMNYDFSNVKIHHDKEAAVSAKEISARAYTYGNNIVFNEGQYNTGSGDGKRLLAHELVHVIQQQPEVLNRQPTQAPPQAQTASFDLNITTQMQWAIEVLMIRPVREEETWACFAAAPESDRPRQLMNYMIQYRGNRAFDQIDRQRPPAMDRDIYLDSVFSYLWSLIRGQFMTVIEARMRRSARFRAKVSSIIESGGCGTVPFLQRGDMFGV